MAAEDGHPPKYMYTNQVLTGPTYSNLVDATNDVNVTPRHRVCDLNQFNSVRYTLLDKTSSYID